MKQIIFIILIYGFSSLALVGCMGKVTQIDNTPHSSSNQSEPIVAGATQSSSALSQQSSDNQILLIQGTIVRKDIEGGFYAIDGDDGQKYDPINLPESYRKNGLKVRITARENRGAMSIHMYGTIIEIIDIEGQ